MPLFITIASSSMGVIEVFTADEVVIQQSNPISKITGVILTSETNNKGNLVLEIDRNGDAATDLTLEFDPNTVSDDEQDIIDNGIQTGFEMTLEILWQPSTRSWNLDNVYEAE